MTVNCSGGSGSSLSRYLVESRQGTGEQSWGGPGHRRAHHTRAGGQEGKEIEPLTLSALSTDLLSSLSLSLSGLTLSSPSHSLSLYL